MLRDDHPQSMRPLVRMFGLAGLWAAGGELGWTIRTGEPSADRALTGGFWGYLTRTPDASRIFGEAMTAKAHGQIADIGGGRGHLINAIVAARPTASGVLFDQPQVVSEAAAMASDRLRLAGGDFFTDPLPVADAYILMEVIHDWDDDAARRILAGVRRAARAGATLLLIEALLPKVRSPNWPTTLDIVMLTIGGRQRTLGEYVELLRE